MSVISTAAWIERRRDVTRKFNMGTCVGSQEIVPLLQEGWDYVAPDGPELGEPLGIHRAPHIAILGDVPASQMRGTPIFQIGMSATQIEAAIYRQCRIGPEPLLDGTTIAEDSFQILPDADYDPARAWLFRVLTGHAPRDLALFLAYMLVYHRPVGKLLLAKDFSGALALAPGLLTEVGWPPSVREGWQENGGDDFLPPFFALLLFAELARLAMTDRSMVALSYQQNGKELTTSGMITCMSPAIDPNIGILPCADNISRLSEMLAFQSTVLLPPTRAFAQRDVLFGNAWSHAAASWIPSLVADYGPQIVTSMLARETVEEARLLAANVKAHPNAWPEARNGYGSSLQRRPAVTYWGLNRRQNVAVGLLELADDARAWNKQYRNGGALLQKATSDQDIANAIQTIVCLWLETTNSEAAHLLDKEIREGFRDKKSRAPTVFDDEGLDDICRRQGFGSGLLRTAKKLIQKRAQPSQEGYTARSKAHLWASRQGNDLAVYEQFQARALADHYARRAGRGGFPLGTPSCVLGAERSFRKSTTKVLPKAKVPIAMTTDVEAAYCAQDNAMLVASSALDPMRPFLARSPAKPIDLKCQTDS
jgi:hypothetical protein